MSDPAHGHSEGREAGGLAAELAARKEEEERLWALLNAIPDVICIKDGEGRWLRANDACLRLFKVGNVDYRGKTEAEIADLTGVFHEVHRVCAQTDLQTWEQGAGTSGEEVLVNPDGSEAAFALSKTPLFNPDGSRRAMIVIGHNITDRRQAETVLADSKERYGLLSEAAQDSIFVIGIDNLVKYVNNFGASQLRMPRASVIGKHVNDLFPPEIAAEYVYWLNYIAQSGQPVRRESETVFAGRRAWLDVRLVPMRDADGKIMSIMGVSRDITDRRQIEDALRDSQLQYRATIDAIGDSLHVVDSNMRILLYNQQLLFWCKSLGFEIDAYGKKLEEVFPFLAPKVWEEYQHVFATGETLFGEDEIRVGDRVCYTETRKIPILEGARVVKVVTIIRDITERKQAEKALQFSEAQFRQSQKMEALGRLAGGVAHDFNNLLTSILGFSRFALESLPEGNAARPDIQEVINGAERAAKLTKQLMAVGRKQMLQVRPIDLNAVVAGMEPLLRRTLGEDMELAIALGEKLGSMNADSGSLEQVILNLAVNARDAMPRGGRLTIQTESVNLDEKDCRGRPLLKPGGHVLLRVRDMGQGMAPDVMAHLFEPFFTTKAKGQGTGLGLSTVYGIVQQCHGHIEVESESGKGTEFRLCFPKATQPAEEAAPKEEPLLPRGSETILVVEDEDAVRRYMVRVLGSLGYRVMEAANAGEALMLCERHKETIHLILTDIIMPQVSGRELIERVSKIRSDFKVLYATGFTQDSVLRYGVTEKKFPVIIKPFTRELLAFQVRQAIESPVQHPV